MNAILAAIGHFQFLATLLTFIAQLVVLAGVLVVGRGQRELWEAIGRCNRYIGDMQRQAILHRHDRSGRVMPESLTAPLSEYLDNDAVGFERGPLDDGLD